MYIRVLGKLLALILFFSVAQAQSVSLPSTGFVGQNIAATITFSSSDAIAVNGIDWGDGVVNAVISGAPNSTKVVTHTFNAAQTYRVRLICNGGKNSKVPNKRLKTAALQNQTDPYCPQAFALITIGFPAPVLSVSPNPAEPNQIVTASITGLSASLAYTLDWGDGSSSDISNKTTATLSKTFAVAKSYTLKLSEGRNLVPPQIVVLQVQLKNPILQVSPLSVGINEDVTATISQLSSTVTYSLEWGDGTQETITGLSTTIRKKKYADNGTKIIKLSASEIAPQIATVLVSVPTPTLDVKPDENKANVAQATIDGLAPSVTYTLDWGDDSTPIIISGVSSTKLQHTYPANAKPVYVIKLNYPGGPVVATINLTLGCQIAFTPSTPNVKETVKANVTGLVANTGYTIVWGDQTDNIITSSGSGTASSNHVFTEAKIYTVQVKLENKLICLGSLNVGSVSVVAKIKIESANQAGLVIESAYPDETVNILLEPLTIGDNYTLDYGDARAKLSFKADNKRRVVPAWYSTQKVFTLTLIQKAKSVSTTLQIGLPKAEETLKLRGEARAELASVFDANELLKDQKYEVDFGNSSKGNLKTNSAVTSTPLADGKSDLVYFYFGESSTTYKNLGIYNLKLFWVGAKGTRIQRASLKIKVLEAFTAQIFGTSLYFIVDKNAVTKFESIKYGTNPSKPAELTIVYKGFGVLEGNVLTDGKATSTLKIELKKNGGEDAGNGKRRLILPFKSFVLKEIGTRKIVFQPTKLNGSVFSSQADEPLEIFVYPKRFSLAGFEFDVKYALGSLEAMNGKANVHLVFAGKDFGFYEVEFSKITATPSIDPEKSTNLKLYFVPGDAIITKGSIKRYLGTQEFTALNSIRFQFEYVLFETDGAKFTGAVRIPYPTCPQQVIVTKKPPPSKELMPDPLTEIFPDFNKPYPADKFSELLENPAIMTSVTNLGEAKVENFSLESLATVGAVNFTMPAKKIFGAAKRNSRLVRASNQNFKPMVIPTKPKNLSNPLQEYKPAPTAKYDYVVLINELKLDTQGGLYLENVQGSIEGYVANLESGNSAINTYDAPAFKNNNSGFTLACSGVSLPNPATLTIDLSSAKSPASDALLDSYGGTTTAPDVGAGWQGVLFPKTSTKIQFIDTKGYGDNISSQGFSLATDIPANVTYEGGYNWSIVKEGGLGAGVVNAWKFNVSSFGMAMFHSKIVSGGGEGTFFLPFFVLDSPGRFYKGEVRINISPKWEIVTDEFIQKDFGSSSVVAGCGVFSHEDGSYPIKFASAYWAVKRLVKTPGNIAYKKAWQPLRKGEFRRKKGSIFGVGLEQHYAKMRADGGIDTQSHCNELQSLKGQISTDAGLQIAMPNLRVFPNANIDMNGQNWRSIDAPNLEIAGQQFPANAFGVGKNADGTHFIGLRSDSYRLAPCDLNNASDCLPAVSTEIRYPIKDGYDQGKVILKGFTIAAEMNPNTKFKQTFADKEIALSGKLYALEKAPNEIWLENYSKNSSLGYLAAASNDFSFESSSPVSASSNTMNMGGIAVTAQMFVRRLNGKVSWGVYAGAISDAPLASLFGVVNVYGLYGGIVYNQRWDATGAYNKLATDFAFNKLKDSSGLQVVAGTVFTVLDGSSFHGAGVLFIDLNDAFAITINVTGWLLEPYATGSGYLGNKPPQARALIQINSSGLSADLCVGNSGAPPNAKIQCQGLENLKLAGLAEIQGNASLVVGSQNHIYIGTYNNPISVTVFPGSSLYKTTATGYLMLGQVDSNSGIPPTATASSGSVTGLYAGFAIKRDIQVGDSGSIDLVVSSCNWSWYAKAGWAVSADFGLTIKPAFEMGAKFSASAYAGAGASGCGVGVDIGITGLISGTIKVTSNSAIVNYTFSGSISTPSPLPDINFSESRKLDLY